MSTQIIPVQKKSHIQWWHRYHKSAKITNTWLGFGGKDKIDSLVKSL